MLRTFIQVESLILVVLSSFFLIRGSMLLTPNEMASLVRTKFGYNLSLLQTLSAQKADYLVGGSMLLLSFAFQMWNLCWPMRIDDFDVNAGGVLWALGFAFFIFLISSLLCKKIARSYYQHGEQILTKKKREQT